MLQKNVFVNYVNLTSSFQIIITEVKILSINKKKNNDYFVNGNYTNGHI